MNNGRNPLRWDCDKQGCFNIKKRPKIEHFAECLPGRIAFSDIDAITEVRGNFLILEWKAYKGEIPTGQSIMFERLSKGGFITVIVICGNAETMEIEAYKKFENGKAHQWKSATLQEIKNKIRVWASSISEGVRA